MSRNIVNKSQGNLDTLQISRELENEGVELSNHKIELITKALKFFLSKVLKEASKSQDVPGLL